MTHSPLNDTPLGNPSSPQATKPRRRRRWIIWLVLALSPFLIILSIRQYRIWQVPLIPEPFDIEVFTRPATIPPENDAFIDYQSIASQLVPRIYLKGFNPDANPFSIRWETLPPSIREFVTSNDPLYQTWLEATRKSVSAGNDDYFDRDRPQLVMNKSRDLIYLAQWNSIRLQDSGKLSEAWESLESGLTFSSHVAQRISVMDYLISNSCTHLIANYLHRWAEDPRVTSNQLRSALKRVIEIHESRPPVSDVIKREYLSIRGDQEYLDRLDSILENPEFTLTEFSDIQFHVPSKILLWSHYISGKKEVSRRLIRLTFANWLAASELPRIDRHSINGLDPDVPIYDLSANSQLDRLSSQLAPQCTHNRILEELLPKIEWIFAAQDRGNLGFQELELMLALQIYFRDHSTFPESLNELSPEILEQIPTNPYDQNRSPLHYRLEADRVVLWNQGNFLSPPVDAGPFSFTRDRDTEYFWTTYPPGTRPPLYRPLPEDPQLQGSPLPSPTEPMSGK